MQRPCAGWGQFPCPHDAVVERKSPRCPACRLEHVRYYERQRPDKKSGVGSTLGTGESGYPGVYASKTLDKWEAVFRGKFLGTYDTPGKAHEAYLLVKQQAEGMTAEEARHFIKTRRKNRGAQSHMATPVERANYIIDQLIKLA